jgi:hypothetical protein
MEEMMKSPIALLLCLLTDVKRQNPDVKGLNRDIITIKNRFKNEGYGFLTVALPSLDHALVRGISSGWFTCPIGFRKTHGGTIPALFSGMFCEIFEPRTGLLKDDVDFNVLKALHGVLLIFKKTLVSPECEELLHQKAVDGFYQCDERASQVVIPDRHDHHIDRVCRYILNPLMKHKETKNVNFKHGPGAVKEGFRSNQKWSELEQVLSRDLYVPDWAGYSEFHVANLPPRVGGRSNWYLWGENNLSTGLPGTQIGLVQIPETDFFERKPRLDSAKLISVLKDSTSRRTITIEPMLNQFLQQGLSSELKSSIDSCKVLGNCIALTHQEYNQKLALEGSRYDNWATIDLKSASDLMSLKLVKLVFRHIPDFYQRMMDCRSPIVEEATKPPLTLGKFAGMGNALTFPVQSVCFAVVCIAAILDDWGVSPNPRNVKRASRCVRVYGDDIIVKTEHAPQVVNWLQNVGLQVNIRKSFLSGNFKESCGVEAFRGVDITPLYLRHRPDQQIGESPSVIASFVSLSNHMWMESLYSASTWLRELVETAIGSSLPLVSKFSGSLGWHTRQDAVEPHKWCRNTHQFLTRTFALVPLKRDDRLDGYAALLKCFHMPREEYKEGDNHSAFPDILVWDSDHLSKTVIRYKTRLTRRWVPSHVVAVKTSDF